MTDDDPFHIPDFLRRRKGERKQPPALPTVPITPSSWDRIRERKRVKARGRVGKMKAVLADRAAAKAGLTWDATRGGWR